MRPWSQQIAHALGSVRNTPDFQPQRGETRKPRASAARPWVTGPNRMVSSGLKGRDSWIAVLYEDEFRPFRPDEKDKREEVLSGSPPQGRAALALGYRVAPLWG